MKYTDNAKYTEQLTDAELLQIIRDLHQKRNTGEQDPDSMLVKHFKFSGSKIMIYFTDEIYQEAHKRFEPVVKQLMINNPGRYIG